MKKIIKNKKSQLQLMSGFVYDIAFFIILFIAFFGIIRTVDSGMYYWRQFYADDLSTLFTVLEGVPEDFTLTYVKQHKGTIFGRSVSLNADISPGYVIISSEDNENHETIEKFVTVKDSKLRIDSPIEALLIENFDSNLDITAPSSCISYNLPKKDFTETVVYTKTDISTLPIEIKKEFEDRILEQYSRIYVSDGFVDNLALCLYNKNIENKDLNPNILFSLKYVESDDNIIHIKYPNKGNIKLSLTLACELFNDLQKNINKKDIFKDINIYIEHKTSTDLQFEGDDDTGMISIEFRIPKNNYNPEFINLFADSMFNAVSNRLDFTPKEISCP